jgi:hypothetical protein
LDFPLFPTLPPLPPLPLPPGYEKEENKSIRREKIPFFADYEEFV